MFGNGATVCASYDMDCMSNYLFGTKQTYIETISYTFFCHIELPFCCIISNESNVIFGLVTCILRCSN